MNLSQSSYNEGDPLSDVLRVFGPQISRLVRLEAGGNWALTFPSRERLKFVAILKGSCWLVRPGHPPQWISAGDSFLIGQTQYTVTSAPEIPAISGDAFFGAQGQDYVCLGGNDTISIGGNIAFRADGQTRFLLSMLPDFLLLRHATGRPDSVAALLSLIQEEINRAGLGSSIITGRLADVLLIEAIRMFVAGNQLAGKCWFAALSDNRLGRALRAIHRDTTSIWTVAQLAAVANMSRAAFSSQFTRTVGLPPLAYIRSWRLTLARTELEQSNKSIASIAGDVGYASQSAFGHAFQRYFGLSPKAAQSARKNQSC